MNQAKASERPPIGKRSDYARFVEIPTRWMDNDIYGHVNNVNYYSFFDTAIADYLIKVGGLDIHQSPVIGVCAESHCRYYEGFSYPEVIDAGLRVSHLGRRAARYEIGLFRNGQDQAAAEGHFVHVFVERASMSPLEIPETIRSALEALVRD